MRKLVFLFLIVAIFFSALVNAEIFISQPKEIYNLGDILSVDLSVKESHAVSDGLLQVSVVCHAKTFEKIFYANGNINLTANELKQFTALWRISGISGKCHLEAEFESETADSQEFLITERIDVSLELSKQYLQPNEMLIIKGKAIKANSVPVEGFAEITVSDIVKSQYVNVEHGNFNLQINLPSHIPVKDYSLQAAIFEKNDKGEITNKGFAEAAFNVVSVPSKLDLSINDEKFLPNQIVIVKASLYDQASEIIKENISIKIKDSKGMIAIDTLVTSGENLEYKLNQDAVPGEWQVEASIIGFTAKRIIYVEKYEAVDISLQDDEIIVKNIGNVPYRKPLEIKFIDDKGIEQTRVQEISLDVNEKSTLKLSASDGIYRIEVSDKKFNNVPLTGAVSASIKLEKSPGILMKYPLLSIFLFILFLVLLIILSQKATQRTVKVKSIPTQRIEKSIAAAKPQEIAKPILSKPSSSAKRQEKEKSGQVAIVPQAVYPIRTAETALVLHGQKQKSSVLYFKAKNIPELQGRISALALESLKNFADRTVVNAIESYNGAVHKISDAEILAIFAPALRNFRHESAAVKAAARIESELKGHNRKLKARLDYGIGINSGEIILNLKRILQYTSTGKTIAIARRLAERASQETIISKDIYTRVMPEVKAKSAGSIVVGDEEIESYILEGISSSREAYSSYIHDVLRRMK
jgi:class 3 adenylate cyclase